MTILTDSLARDHLAGLEATAAATHRAREARVARREARRAGKAQRAAAAVDSAGSEHHRVATIGHAAARPFTAFQCWLAAGQL